MSFSLRSFVVTALLVSVLTMGRATAGSLQDRSAPLRRKPIVIVAEMVNRRITYTVDSKPALPDILRVLSVLREERGKDWPVVALVDDRAPIKEMGNIDGIAGKAGFPKVKFFVFDKEDGLMGAVDFGSDMPFSTNPPVD